MVEGAVGLVVGGEVVVSLSEVVLCEMVEVVEVVVVVVVVAVVVGGVVSCLA